MLSKFRVDRILDNYCAQIDVEERKQKEMQNKRRFIYRAPNPYRQELEDALANREIDLLINTFSAKLKQRISSVISTDLFKQLLTAAYQRNNARLFAEPCVCAVEVEKTAASKSTQTGIIFRTLAYQPNEMDTTSTTHAIIRMLGEKGLVQLSNPQLPLERLSSDKHIDIVRTLISFADKDKLATTLDFKSLLELGGAETIKALCDEALPLPIGALTDKQVDAVFGHPDTLPHALPLQYASALPMVTDRILRHRNISPVTFIDTLPEWQREYVTLTVLNYIC